tara:strand:- start:534 stop:767 length:234 start_codon:yes stop_codon:yes gene_type:complete
MVEETPPDISDSSSADFRETDSKKSKGTGSVVLGAAMIAMGEILEPEKTTVEIVQTNDDPEPDMPFDLDFGDLPPLE